MPSNEELSFSVVGMVPTDQDGPGFCTPVFRDRDGRKFFMQSSQVGRLVDEYVHVGDGLPVSSYIPYRINGEFRVGDRLHIGFRMPDRSIIFGRKRKVCQLVLDRQSELTDYPFLLLQIARRFRSPDVVREALGHDEVRNAVVQNWIALRPNEPRFVWTKANDKRLYDLFHAGNSLSEIARVLGVSRNAVASKIKRSGLNLRTFLGEQADLFGSSSSTRKAVPDPSIELEHHRPTGKYAKSSYSPPPNLYYVSTEENRSKVLQSAPNPKKR